MPSIHIHQQAAPSGEVLRLPASKSLSNRALILQALAGNQPVVSNLSDARDTVLMNRLVTSKDHIIDVMDAGTTMRFLTSYFATTRQNKVLTGTPRMKERPIGLLVDALRKLGASIDYLDREGFPPIETLGFSAQKTREISIPGNVSSQYISSLMMVGPTLPMGIDIKLTGKVGSRPYIEMTAALMMHFGVRCELGTDSIRVPPGSYKPSPYRVEGDWSGASYWFAFVALAKSGSIIIPGVSDKSLQGDRAIVEIMNQLGVTTRFTDDGAVLEKGKESKSIEWDFTNCPDLAQTVLPVCAARGINGTFTGMESLFIKETDRVAALRNELGKIGASIEERIKGTWILTPGNLSGISKLQVDTYHDHRMAMGLAPLATMMSLEIKDPEVVNKSYPGFWEDMRSVGFQTSED